MAEHRKPGGADGAAFTVMMAIAAYFGRANPHFVHPQILWGFLALLAFNLLYFSRFSRRPAVSAWGNAALVVPIVLWSGGTQSYFWVMFLLPIFTASLALAPKGVLAVSAACAAALAGFYAGAFARGSWPEALEWAVKAATLGISALAVGRVAARERGARLQLEAERERAAKDRVEARLRVQHMDRLATLGTLSATIAHELNTPLGSILGFAEVALSGLPAGASQGDLLKRIEAGARRCKQIIQDMRAFARGERAAREDCDVNALVRECVELKMFDWAPTLVRCEERYADPAPRALLPGSRVQQVVFNLLANAEHAVLSKPGAGLIVVRTSAEGPMVRVSVEDDGPGLPPEVLARLGESFMSTKIDGTGLGLMISKQIVEDLDGWLRAENRPEGGARFTVELPTNPPDVPRKAASEEAPTTR